MFFRKCLVAGALAAAASLTACQEEAPWTGVGIVEFDRSRFEQLPLRPGSYIGQWAMRGANIFSNEYMELRPDSTFYYQQGNCLSHVYSMGTWKKVGNVIVLDSYERFAQPWQPPGYKMVRIAAKQGAAPVGVALQEEGVPTSDTNSNPLAFAGGKLELSKIAIAGNFTSIEYSKTGRDTTHVYLKQQALQLIDNTLCAVSTGDWLGRKFEWRNPGLPVIRSTSSGLPLTGLPTD